MAFRTLSSSPVRLRQGCTAKVLVPPLSTISTSARPQMLEEQALHRYHQKRYYPVRIGDTIGDRYLILAKMGYGAYSTVWLARDERSKTYSCVKVCVNDTTDGSPTLNEVTMLRHLAKVARDDHPGLDFTRLASDIFQVESQAGPHYCIVTKPHGVSIRTLQENSPNAALPKLLVKSLIHRLLFAINFLHVRANVIHTDISPTNVLLQAEDDSSFQLIEDLQKSDGPSVVHGYPFYESRRVMTALSGHPILTDFGQMRPADPINYGWCMPDLYRAPEVLLGLAWDFPVDIWSVGIMTLELLEGRNVVNPVDTRDNKYVVPLALAQYISILGLPPAEMISKSRSCATHFDEDGNWAVAECPIPQTSLEDFVSTISAGKEKDLFLAFIRKALTWDPEERATANELIEDEWLMMPN